MNIYIIAILAALSAIGAGVKFGSWTIAIVSGLTVAAIVAGDMRWRTTRDHP